MSTTAVAGTRLRQLPPVLRPLRAALRWQPAVGASAVAAALLAWQADDLDDAGTALVVLRAVAALLALGASFLLDDAAADTLACSPTSLAWRRSAYLLAGGSLIAVPWAGAVLTVRALGAEVPVAALTVEYAALVALAVGVSAALTRWADAREPGVLAAPLTVGLLLASVRLPERWALVVVPGPAWDGAHQRWALVLAAALVAVVVGTRDRART